MQLSLAFGKRGQLTALWFIQGYINSRHPGVYSLRFYKEQEQD